MKKPFLLTVLCLLTSTSTLLGQEMTKMKQVVHAHNLAMDKMPRLVQLVSNLQPKADTTVTGMPYQTAIDELKASNKAMMTWMQGFGKRFTADEMMKDKALSDKKKVWLDEEAKKIKALQKKIDSSIKKAEKLLEK